MPAKRVIPCLDVKDGEVVKGVRFEDLRTLGSPVALAQRYDREGADELVFLDISATAEGRATQHSWVEAVARSVSIPLTVGGGVASVADVAALLRAGADKVALNSAALARPALVAECADAFGSQCVVVVIDVRRDAALGHRVYGRGGRDATQWSAVGWWSEVVTRGAGEVLLTSIDGDGTMGGFDLELVAQASELRIPVIASGGGGRPEHFLAALEAGADAVLAATVFHEERVGIGELKRLLASRGQEVRL